MKKQTGKLLLRAFLINLVIAFAVFIPYLIKGHGLLTMSNDFDAQELAFGMFANQAIKTGQTAFNWNIDIGSEFIPSFGFYNLGSPFFWLTLPFPAKVFPYLMGWVYMLKYAVAGTCMALYAGRYVRQEKWALLASVLYAFCGYQATNLVFYHFHDAMAFFPLLLWGLDEMMATGKRGIFALCAGINCLTNWNFFVGEVIIVIIYYLFRYDAVARLREKKFGEVFPEVFWCLAEGLLGVGLAGIILIPSVVSMLSSSRLGDTILGKDAISRDSMGMLSIVRALLMPGDIMSHQAVLEERNWYSMSAYLPLIGIVPSAVYMKKHPRSFVTKMLWTQLVIAVVPLLNSVFVVFNREPYYRWIYMAITFLVLGAVLMLEEAAEEKKAGALVKASAAVLAAQAFFLWFVSHWRWDYSRENIVNYPQPFKILGLAAVAGTVLFGAVCLVLSKKKKPFYAALLSFAALGGWFNSFYNVNRYQDWKDYESRDLYAELTGFTDRLEPDLLPYRYELQNFYYDLNFAQGLTSVNSFISTIDPSIFTFYEAIGHPRHVCTEDGPAGTQQVLSVKYYIYESALEGREAAFVYNNGYHDHYVYEDENALPLGFGYDTYILRSELDRLPYEYKAKMMLKSLVIYDDQEDKVRDILTHAPLPESIDDEEMRADMIARKKNASVAFSHSTTGFSCRVDAEKPMYVFFSVPHSKRWSAFVNGQEAEIQNICGLMAVRVTEGENEIRFVYRTSWLKLGIAVSIASLACIAILLGWTYLRGRKQ